MDEAQGQRNQRSGTYFTDNWAESNACKRTFFFESVIGNGKVHELVDIEEKIEGLKQIMEQYSGKEWAFGERRLDNIRVWKITIETITGKQSKEKTAT